MTGNTKMPPVIGPLFQQSQEQVYSYCRVPMSYAMCHPLPMVRQGHSVSMHDQTDGSQYGTETLTSTRGGSSAYSTASATVSITVDDANDPPTMTAATTSTLSAISEGDTSTVTLNTYATTLIGDVDTASAFATLGVAVTGFTETEAGCWEYSSDGGSTWSNFSDLSSTVSESAAFLIDTSDSNGQIRFVSNTSNGETATLDFYAWDQSSGTAGTQVDITAVYADVDSAYSASGSTNTFSLTVNDLNDAPVLGSGVADFTAITEYETTNSGASGQYTSQWTGCQTWILHRRRDSYPQCFCWKWFMGVFE